MRPIISTMMLLLHLHGVPYHQKDEKLIETTCRTTPDYDLCMATLLKDPRSSKADLAGLSIVFVDAVKEKATETLKMINRLKTSRPELRGALSNCRNAYIAVLEADVPEAIEALKKGDPKFAENGMADTTLEANGCEANFGPGKSPLTQYNKAVHDLSVVARAIIRNLL